MFSISQKVNEFSFIHSLEDQPETVVVELVVRSHGNKTTPGTAQGVEDLWGSISPNLEKQTHMQTVKKKKKQ